MKFQLGYSFLELIVVIAIVSIIAVFSVSSNKQLISANRLLSEAEKTASAISQAIIQARSSQTSIKINCSSSGLQGNFYRASRSNALNFSLSVISATSGASTSAILTTYPSSIVLTCPTSCGSLYITSDGTILSANACNQYDFLFASTSNPELRTKLTLSALGYPRIYLLDSLAKNTWTEVVK